jgi:hypothetical protein
LGRVSMSKSLSSSMGTSKSSSLIREGWRIPSAIRRSRIQHDHQIRFRSFYLAGVMLVNPGFRWRPMV